MKDDVLDYERKTAALMVTVDEDKLIPTCYVCGWYPSRNGSMPGYYEYREVTLMLGLSVSYLDKIGGKLSYDDCIWFTFLFEDKLGKFLIQKKVKKYGKSFNLLED